MFIARIPAGRQALVPVEVLDALGLKPGDTIAYEVDLYGEVVLTRGDDPFVNPFAVFTEWGSDADREAFADL